MSFGIVLSDTDINESVSYDSRKPRPQIALERDPAHLGIEEVKGTAIATNVGNGYYNEETLLTVKHGLGYSPASLVYFYFPNTESYFVGTGVYGAGAVDDLLIVDQDETNLYIKHTLEDFLSAGYTSTAPSFGKIRVKYMIFSNPIGAITNEALDT